MIKQEQLYNKNKYAMLGCIVGTFCYITARLTVVLMLHFVPLNDLANDGTELTNLMPVIDHHRAG
jgi:hypothetical protein